MLVVELELVLPWPVIDTVKVPDEDCVKSGDTEISEVTEFTEVNEGARVCVGDTDELGELIELYVIIDDDELSSVCETDSEAVPVLLGHVVKEELADGEILELGDPVKMAEGLPESEAAVVGLTVTVYDTVFTPVLV
jgi:hypothetical protein